MKPGSVVDPDAMRHHVAKFKRRAKFMDQDHIAQVLQRFPEKDRQAVFNEVVQVLPFEAKYPSTEEFRKASLSAHALVAEVKERQEREAKEHPPTPKPKPDPPPKPVPPKPTKARRG